MGRRSLAPLLLALTLGACVSGPTSFYHWGTYNETLYAHYRAPQEREAWVEGLKTTILEAEQRGEKVPPGLYAEYGYALFEEGNTTQAIANYQKEAALWPEARFFMEKMVRNAEQRGRQPTTPTTGPAGALEKT
jgi:hypothetical protein